LRAELRELVGEDATSTFLRMSKNASRSATEEKDALRGIFSRVMKCTAADLKSQLDRLLARLALLVAESKDSDDNKDAK
jgi:hypothetical protein